MIVVSDASPLGSLAAIDYLWVLQAIYGTVVVPEVVARELATAKSARLQAVLSLDWILVRSPTELAIAEAQQQSKRLDPGETHAIALALQLKADELLINERLGRRVAQDLGLSVIGIFGILIAAKQKGHIPSVRRVMDGLVEQAGFRVSYSLYERVLKFAGEI